MHDKFIDLYYAEYEQLENEWYSGEKQTWELIRRDKLLKLFYRYAKFGVVDEDLLVDIEFAIQENTMRLIINTTIWHGNDDFFEDIEDSEIEEHLERFALFIEDDSHAAFGRNMMECDLQGLMRYSDGYQYLSKYLEESCRASSGNLHGRLAIISKILNVVHGSGDLAKWYVEGGDATLCEIEEFFVRGISFWHGFEREYHQRIQGCFGMKTMRNRRFGG